MLSRRAGVRALACAAATCLLLVFVSAASAMEPIVVAGGGFQTAISHRSFVPYGFNYGVGTTSRVESYVEHADDRLLARIGADFQRMHALGANLARIYLQLPDFMTSPTTVDPQALRSLRAVLDAASAAGMRIDVTGNLVWHPDRAPAWYETLTEQQRWDVQATFWRAVAGACASADAVMFYELTSEPLVDDGIDPTQPGAWYGGEFGGLAFAQRISLQRDGRSPVAIARQWIAKLTRAVRASDPTHLVTVGLLPDTRGAFAPRKVADLLDFLTVHEYPTTHRAAPAIATMKRFAAASTPVLVGETFQLRDDPATQSQFLTGAHRYVAGYLTFFDGRTPDDIGRPATTADAVYQDTLNQFLALRPYLATRPREVSGRGGRGGA
jgi:Cellulase (glycosyl hydrolase family 5)